MFYNTEYGFYDNAASKKDGLAAISVLLKVRYIPETISITLCHFVHVG